MSSRFIRVVACVTTYFIPFYYHIFYSMFMLLFKTPVFSLWRNELFPLVCTVNNAAMNICICIMFVGMYLFVFSWVVPSSRTAGSYGDCVTSSGADKLLYRVTAPFLCSDQQNMRFSISPHPCICYRLFFYYSHSSACELISLCKSSCYMLDTSYTVCKCSVGFLFHIHDNIVSGTKCFYFDVSNLLLYFDVISNKPLPSPSSQRHKPLFSSKGFIVLTLTFRSVIPSVSYFLGV